MRPSSGGAAPQLPSSRCHPKRRRTTNNLKTLEHTYIHPTARSAARSALSRSFAAALLLLLSALPAALRAQVIVDNRLDRSAILIGEQANLTATVTADAQQKVVFPTYSSGDSLTSGVEVVTMGKIDTVRLNDGKRLKLTRQYTLTSFDSALYSLPPFAVTVDGQEHRARTTLGLKVSSVPVDTVNVQKFAPPFPVVEAPFEWTDRLSWMCLSLWPFVLLAFYFAIRLSSKKPRVKTIVVPPETPPYARASQRLEPLKAAAEEELMDRESGRQYFIALTDAIRQYLHARYGFNAMEKTTREIVDGLKTIVSPEDLALIQSLFSLADDVKYAKRETTPYERSDAYRRAQQFLASTRDEEQERPKPTIITKVYSDVQQHRLRRAWTIGLLLSTLATIVLFAWCVWSIFDAYLT